MATAQQMAEFLGNQLVTDELTEGTIKDLIKHDNYAGFQFQNAITEYLKHKQILASLSVAAQRKLIFENKTDSKYIVETLDYIYKEIDKQRQQTTQSVLKRAQEASPEEVGREIAAERRKNEITRLRDLVTVDLPVKQIPRIIAGITEAIKKGWMAGAIPIYYQQAVIPYDLNSLRKLFPAPAPAPSGTRGRGRGRGGRGRGSRGRGTQANTTQNVQSKQTTYVPALTPTIKQETTPRRQLPQAANQLHKRDQFATHVPKVYDPQLGERINWTKLKFISQYCNNFQIWGKCAVYAKNQAACTYIRRCSNCDSQDHGRRKCPHLSHDEYEPA